MKGVRFLALAAWLMGWAGSAAAQQTIDYASLSGRVTDPWGAVIAGAAVAARHVDTNATRTAATDEDGRLRFPYLRIGTYEIRVVQPGFREVTRAVTLTAAAALDLPVTGAPVFPNVLPAVVPSVTLVNLATMDYNLQNGYSQQASAEIEQQLRGRMTVGLTYQYLRA